MSWHNGLGYRLPLMCTITNKSWFQYEAIVFLAQIVFLKHGVNDAEMPVQ